MTTSDKVFTGSMPAIYDRYLGPLIFQPYAVGTAERIAGLSPRHILETAAGTGILTRAIVRRLPHVSIVATDLNQPMLDHAAAHTSARAVTWRQADAQALPFDRGSFDVVVCQFGVMFFPDKAKAFSEARRVLKPGGSFLFSVWDRIEENETAELVARAVADQFPNDPPRFLSRTPHGHYDLAPIRSALEAAGFSDIRTETLAKRARAPSPRDPAIGFCQGSPLRGEIEARDKTRLEAVTQAAADAVARRLGPGPIDGKMQAHVITATR